MPIKVTHYQILAYQDHLAEMRQCATRYWRIWGSSSRYRMPYRQKQNVDCFGCTVVALWSRETAP